MDQYFILGRIGEGAHGIVFKAKHVEVRSRLVGSRRGARCVPSVVFSVLRSAGAQASGISRLLGGVPSVAISLPAAELRESVP